MYDHDVVTIERIELSTRRATPCLSPDEAASIARIKQRAAQFRLNSHGATQSPRRGRPWLVLTVMVGACLL